jgi:hypothetical protein
MTSAISTTDHDRIRSWAEMRNGRPARIDADEPGDILLIDFGDEEPEPRPIDWDEFFTIFEERRLAFLHQDTTENGSFSRFGKFVPRDGEAQ